MIDTRSVVYPRRCWAPFRPPPPRKLGTSPVQRAEGGKQVFLSLDAVGGDVEVRDRGGSSRSDACADATYPLAPLGGVDVMRGPTRPLFSRIESREGDRQGLDMPGVFICYQKSSTRHVAGRL